MWAGLDIIPHSPTLLEGKKYHAETVRHLQKLGAQYEELGGVVVVTPSLVDDDVFPVNSADPLHEQIDWKQFDGIASVESGHWDGLPFLADTLQRSARSFGVPVGMRPGPIDHTVWSPLRWMFPRQIPMPILPVGLSELGPRNHYRFGLAIRDAVIEAPKPIAVLISSNLTHRDDWSNKHKTNLPPKGKAFDQALIAALQDGNWETFDDLGDDVKSTARPDASNRLWYLVRGLTQGLRGELRHYSPELGAYGMALVHYDTETANAA